MLSYIQSGKSLKNPNNFFYKNVNNMFYELLNMFVKCLKLMFKGDEIAKCKRIT